MTSRRIFQIWAAVAFASLGLVLVLLALQGCALAPSHADLMKACMSSQAVQDKASQLGMTAEDLCRELLREAPDAASSMQQCGGDSAGSCPIR